MTKTKLYNWQHAPEQLDVDTRETAVVVAPIVTVEQPPIVTQSSDTMLFVLRPHEIGHPRARPAVALLEREAAIPSSNNGALDAGSDSIIDPAHAGGGLGSILVKDALAQQRPSSLVAPQRVAAERWAAAAAPGTRTVVVQNADDVGQKSKQPAAVHVKHQRGEPTTRLLAGFRQLRRSHTARVRAGLAGLAVACVVGGYQLGTLGRPRPVASRAPVAEAAPAVAAPLPLSLPQEAEQAHAVAAELPPRAAPEAAGSSSVAPSEREAIDALISGDRSRAISHYRALAARHPERRAFSATAEILSKRAVLAE